MERMISPKFDYEPLTCNKFITILPEILKINDFEIFETEVIKGLIRNKINIDVIESKSRNVAKQFEDIEVINEKLGNDSFIEIQYLDPTGELIKTEKYTNVRLVKTIRKFPTLNYGTNRLITTTLQFSFDGIEYNDTRN